MLKKDRFKKLAGLLKEEEYSEFYKSKDKAVDVASHYLSEDIYKMIRKEATSIASKLEGDFDKGQIVIELLEGIVENLKWKSPKERYGSENLKIK